MDSSKVDISEFSKVKYVEIPSGETLAYREVLSPSKTKAIKRTVLLVSSILSSSLIYQTGGLLERLVKEIPDTRFIGLDRRGEGLSTYNTKLSSVEDHVEDVREFLKLIGVKKVVFVSFCDSGLTGLLLAAKHPEVVEALVLIGTVPSAGSYNLVSEETFPRTVEDIENTKVYKKITKVLSDRSKDQVLNLLIEQTPSLKSISTSDLETILSEALRTRSLKESLFIDSTTNLSSKTNGFVRGTSEIKSITAKTVIIVGEKDSTYVREDVLSTKDEIPRSELYVIKGAGKITWLSDLEGTVEPIKEVIKSVSA